MDDSEKPRGQVGLQPGDEVKRRSGSNAGPELLQGYLASQQCHPLEALTAIATARWEQATEGKPDQFTAMESVAVPWWVVNAISVAWCRYRYEGEPLEQAFGVSRMGAVNPHARGLAATSPLVQRDKLHFHADLALEVADRVKDGGKVESIIADVAKAFNVSTRTVWEAWGTHGELCQAIVAKSADCK